VTLHRQTRVDANIKFTNCWQRRHSKCAYSWTSDGLTKLATNRCTPRELVVVVELQSHYFRPILFKSVDIWLCYYETRTVAKLQFFSDTVCGKSVRMMRLFTYDEYVTVPLQCLWRDSVTLSSTLLLTYFSQKNVGIWSTIYEELGLAWEYASTRKRVRLVLLIVTLAVTRRRHRLSSYMTDNNDACSNLVAYWIAQHCSKQ